MTHHNPNCIVSVFFLTHFAWQTCEAFMCPEAKASSQNINGCSDWYFGTSVVCPGREKGSQLIPFFQCPILGVAISQVCCPAPSPSHEKAHIPQHLCP